MSEGRIDLTLALPTLTPEDYSIFSGLLAISVIARPELIQNKHSQFRHLLDCFTLG